MPVHKWSDLCTAACQGCVEICTLREGKGCPKTGLPFHIQVSKMKDPSFSLQTESPDLMTFGSTLYQSPVAREGMPDINWHKPILGSVLEPSTVVRGR